MIDFEEIFQELKKNYRSILEVYYPTNGNKGFTETNLTVNFVEAYKKHNPGTIAWYEAPLANDCNKKLQCSHIDCVLFDKNNKSTIFIESKRLNCSKKQNEAEDDLIRILDNKNRDFICKNYNKLTNHYCIILAEIWTHTKSKTERYNMWKEEKAFENNSFKELNGTYYLKNFKDQDTISVEFIRQDYNIMGFVVKI